MSDKKVIEKDKGKKRKKGSWVITGICVSLIMASIFTSFYGVFENAARRNLISPLESEEQIAYLYNNSYMLYRDLYNRMNNTNLDFVDLYFETEEGYEWLLEEETLSMEGTDFVSKLTDVTISEETADYVNLDIFYGYLEAIRDAKKFFDGLERKFTQLNTTYDYIIKDLNADEYVTNLTSPNINIEEQFFYVNFYFDENGNVSIDGNIKGNDVTKLRKSVNEAIRSGSLHNFTQDKEINQYLKAVMPRNCKITFCISNVDWNRMEIFDRYDAYRLTPCLNVYLLFTLIVLLAGLFWPGFKETKPWNSVKICSRMPVEGLAAIVCLSIGMATLAQYLAMWVNGGDSVDSFAVFMSRHTALVIVYGLNILALTIFMFVAWYIGICLKALRESGFKKYIKERSLVYQVFPFINQKSREIYRELMQFDVTKDAKKLIIKVVLVNGIVLFIIGCFPLGGLVIAALYSVVLYFLLKKYISDLQKKYSILLQTTNAIAEGNLNTDIKENLGVFEPFKPQIIKIQDGFRKAVEEEVKSQRMRSELITNVSHDLKTPLTAIITYIDLLKDENLTEENRREYIDTLERKSMRLKVLIEDLFEVSKANSQNLTLNIVDVDIVNLLKQTTFEMEDKLKEKKLDIRADAPNEKVILKLDSQKTYRIFENLLGNVAKYALEGTRVYIQCVIKDEDISIIIKNITAQEIQVSAEELTERFVRGDISRNTEGSGLGLAIAKSFTELQGGKFKIDVDGDLFKVSVVFSRG